MGIGTGIFLIVVGAILAFAIEPDVWEVVDLNMVGYILIVGGIVALVLGLVYSYQHSNRRSVVEHYDERTPPPPM